MGFAPALIGMAVKAYGAHKQAKDMQKAEGRQMSKQAKYQKQMTGLFDASAALSGLDEANKQIKTGTERAERGYAQAQAVPLSTATSRGVTMGSGLPAQNAWASLVGALRAPAQGYNEFTLQQMIKNLRSAQQMTNLQQQSQLSAAAAPLHMQNAMDKSGWLQILGSGIGMAGNLAGGMGGGVTGAKS